MKTKENFEEGCCRRMGEAKGMCMEHLLCASHFKNFMAYGTYKHPIKYIQLPPIEQRKKGGLSWAKWAPRVTQEGQEARV